MVTTIRVHSVALFRAMYVIFVGYDMLKTKISELKEIALKRELKVFIFTAYKDLTISNEKSLFFILTKFCD